MNFRAIKERHYAGTHTEEWQDMDDLLNAHVEMLIYLKRARQRMQPPPAGQHLSVSDYFVLLGEIDDLLERNREILP